MNAFGTGRAMLVVAGLAATLTAGNAFAGNVVYPITAATPYYTAPTYVGAAPMISGYRPVYSGVTSCPGGVCPIQPVTTRYPLTGVAGAGVPGNCPGGICYPTSYPSNCVNGQCPPTLGTKAVYPVYKVAPKPTTTTPVYYTTPKSAPAAVDTPVFYESYESATPAPRGGVTPAGGMVTDSPFYP